MSTIRESANGTPKVALKSAIRTEPSPRWVRVEFNGEMVVDSRRALYVWAGSPIVTYYFPWEDVRADLLTRANSGNDGRQYFDLTVGDRTAKAAAWSYPDPEVDMAPLGGYVTFRWNAMDHWYEEAEEIFLHPRDPYHRVDAVPGSRHIKIELDGRLLAETRRPVLLFETGLPTRYYIPQEDIHLEYLIPSPSSSVCPYKGTASYWNVKIEGREYEDTVWGYLDPIPECPKIKGLLSFYNEKVDITVDGELQERPHTPWS